MKEEVNFEEIKEFEEKLKDVLTICGWMSTTWKHG